MLTSEYRTLMAEYKEDIFEFSNQGASTFDRMIWHLARYLATNNIKGIMA